MVAGEARTVEVWLYLSQLSCRPVAFTLIFDRASRSDSDIRRDLKAALRNQVDQRIVMQTFS